MYNFLSFLTLKLNYTFMSSNNHQSKGNVLAFLRASTNKQDLNNQKLELFEYARINNLHIGNFIEITTSSRKTKKQRRIEEVMETKHPID